MWEVRRSCLRPAERTSIFEVSCPSVRPPLRYWRQNTAAVSLQLALMNQRLYRKQWRKERMGEEANADDLRSEVFHVRARERPG